jgi:hypothetical protein
MCAVLKAASRVLLLLTLVLASASAGRADPITPYASATNFFIDRLDGGTLQGFFRIGQVPNGETFVVGHCFLIVTKTDVRVRQETHPSHNRELAPAVMTRLWAETAKTCGSGLSPTRSNGCGNESLSANLCRPHGSDRWRACPRFPQGRAHTRPGLEEMLSSGHRRPPISPDSVASLPQ